MDRKFRVLNKSRLVAEVKISYERELSGKVFITTYGWYKLDDLEETICVYPRGSYEFYIHHDHPLNSIEEIRAFDLSYIKKNTYIPAEDLVGSLDLEYERVHYRYFLSTHIAPIGIVDIKADFNENSKELQFISTREIRDDHSISSDSVESNMRLMKRLEELEFLNLPYADYKEVQSWHW